MSECNCFGAIGEAVSSTGLGLPRVLLGGLSPITSISKLGSCLPQALTIIITTVITPIMPLRQQLQCLRIRAPLRLDKHRLLRMYVGPIVRTGNRHIALRAIIHPTLVAVPHRHHDADFIPVCFDE